MKKSSILTLLAGLLLLSACKKDVAPGTDNPVNDVTLKADKSFSWKSTKAITIAIKGTPVSTTVERKFSIELSTGELVYAANLNMSKDYQFNLTLPAHAEKLVYKYGSITKEATISGSIVTLDYLVTTDNGYVE